MSRYVVKKGSNSGHCCFVYSVMDSFRKVIERADGGKDSPEAVCECFYEKEANMIADALNRAADLKGAER